MRISDWSSDVCSSDLLKLSIPTQPNLFKPLVDHPRVLRVVALSGGFSREEACRELAKNDGMIASFSRALLADLRHQMSDEEFDRTLGQAIHEISQASTEKADSRPSSATPWPSRSRAQAEG